MVLVLLLLLLLLWEIFLFAAVVVLWLEAALLWLEELLLLFVLMVVGLFSTLLRLYHPSGPACATRFSPVYYISTGKGRRKGDGIG